MKSSTSSSGRGPSRMRIGALSLKRLLDVGADQVVCVLHQRARPRGSAYCVELHYGAVYTVTDGQIRRIDIYESGEQALAAVGVMEPS